MIFRGLLQVVLQFKFFFVKINFFVSNFIFTHYLDFFRYIFYCMRPNIFLRRYLQVIKNFTIKKIIKGFKSKINLVNYEMGGFQV
jgi:hypothetical protein